ncbi:MAG: hypothetical protein WD491_06515 [Balneolales bacterium]
MKFKFKLESILRVRMHEEDLEKQKLASLQNEESLLRRQFDERRENLRKVNASRNAMELVNHNRERMMQNYLLEEGQALNKLTQVILKKKEAIDKQRMNVIEANKKFKIIKKLKQKALVNYVHEMDRQDQIIQNEIATQVYYKQLKQ